MGAQFWQHESPYEPDPAAALRRLQIAVYRNGGYDLAKLLDERIRGMMESVRYCEKDDPYGLLEHYRDCAQGLQLLAAQRLPEDAESQVGLLRRIEAISSDYAPGVLAMEGVSRRRAEGKVQVLTKKRMKKVFGTATPSLQEARDGVDRLADSIDRGSGICFPVYARSQPILWYFAGYTAD